MKWKLAWAAATLFLMTKSFAYPVPPVVLAPAYDNFTDHSCAETRCPNMFGEFLEPALSPVGVSPGDTVTNSFQWNKGAKAEFVRLVLWGSTPESLDWAITTEPFGGTKLGSGTEKSFTPEERASGMFMFDLDLNVWLPPGTYWLQLSNAIGADGWDVSAALRWLT